MTLNSLTLLRDLVAYGILTREQAMRIVEGGPEPLGSDALLQAESRVGDVWEVVSPFGVVGGLIVPSGYVAWTLRGAVASDHELEGGDLLLVVRDRVGTLAQTLMVLSSGRTFEASGWQQRCERVER